MNLGTFIGSKIIPHNFDQSFIENPALIDQLVGFGFIPSSIEYCLKYNVIDDLVNFDVLSKEAKWCPFEWSLKPKCLDLNAKN